MRSKNNIKKLIEKQLRVVSRRYIHSVLEKSCPDLYCDILELTQFLDSKNNVKFVERLYCILHDIKKIPVCGLCHKPTNFKRMTSGYCKHCSVKCAANSKRTKTKRTKTNLEKYGASNPLGNKEIYKKGRQTMVEKYGVEHPMQSEALKAQTQQTNLEKYGASNPLGNKEIRKKRTKTMVKKYGVEHPIQSPIIKSRIYKTMKSKYGVKHSIQSSVINSKRKQTMIERYGVPWSAQSKEIMDKITKTKIKNDTCYIFPSVGTNEKCLLDLQEKVDMCKIDRDFTILNYKPDGYCYASNTVYEVYEKRHKKQKKHDLKRQAQIQNELQCDFVVIWDLTH